MSVTKCPSCGSTNIFYDHRTHTIECLSCGYKTPWKTTAYEALEKMEPTNPISEAVVTEKEIPMFTPAFLSEVKKAWETRQSTSFWDWIIEPASYPERGVYVMLRGVKKPHEFFPSEIIEKMEYDTEKQVYRVRGLPELKKWKLWFTSPIGFEHFVEVEAHDLDEAKEKALEEVPKGSEYRGQVG